MSTFLDVSFTNTNFTNTYVILLSFMIHNLSVLSFKCSELYPFLISYLEEIKLMIRSLLSSPVDWATTLYSHIIWVFVPF